MEIYIIFEIAYDEIDGWPTENEHIVGVYNEKELAIKAANEHIKIRSSKGNSSCYIIPETDLTFEQLSTDYGYEFFRYDTDISSNIIIRTFNINERIY